MYSLRRIIYPKLQPHQGAFVVPGTFACSGQPLGPQAVQVVDKLQGFLDWAKVTLMLQVAALDCQAAVM